jgi:zinc transporter, ZIP family
MDPLPVSVHIDGLFGRWMLYVSFVEIFKKGVDALVAVYGESAGRRINAASFFSGMFLIGAIDNLIPSAENPHVVHEEKETAPLHDPAAPYPGFKAVARKGNNAALGFHEQSRQNRKLLCVGFVRERSSGHRLAGARAIMKGGGLFNP